MGLSLSKCFWHRLVFRILGFHLMICCFLLLLQQISYISYCFWALVILPQSYHASPGVALFLVNLPMKFVNLFISDNFSQYFFSNINKVQWYFTIFSFTCFEKAAKSLILWLSYCPLATFYRQFLIKLLPHWLKIFM